MGDRSAVKQDTSRDHAEKESEHVRELTFTGGQDEYTGLTLNYLILPRWEIQHAGTFHRIADIRVNPHIFTHTGNMHTHTQKHAHTWHLPKIATLTCRSDPLETRRRAFCYVGKGIPSLLHLFPESCRLLFLFTTKVKSSYLISLRWSEDAQKNWHCSQRKSLSLCITHPHSNTHVFWGFFFLLLIGWILASLLIAKRCSWSKVIVRGGIRGLLETENGFGTVGAMIGSTNG